MEIQYIQGVLLMKEKINFGNCIKRKCNECKNYNYCFGYKKKKTNKKSQSNKILKYLQ